MGPNLRHLTVALLSWIAEPGSPLTLTHLHGRCSVSLWSPYTLAIAEVSREKRKQEIETRASRMMDKEFFKDYNPRLVLHRLPNGYIPKVPVGL